MGCWGMEGEKGQQDRRGSSQREEGKLCGGVGHLPLGNIFNWCERDCPAAKAAAVVLLGSQGDLFEFR